MQNQINKFLEVNLSMNNPIDSNKMLSEDINQTLKKKDLFEQFRNKNILVTGSTGLIARVLVYTLLVANEKLDLNLTLFPIARNVEKAKRLYGEWYDSKALQFIFQDVREKIECDQKLDFVFHAAAATGSKTLIERPIESFETQVLGMENILRLAERDNAKVLYFSSMEIYGQPVIEGMSTEKDLGYVDPLVIRSGYPEAKRACEFLGKAFSEERGVFVVNARLAQTFGPGVLKDDNRVFAQFIRGAINNEDLVLHTDGSSLGNYCYIRDVIEALLLLIKVGKTGNSYNVVNEATNVSIKEMAELVANKFGNGKVVIDIPDEPTGYAPKVNLHLSGEKMRDLGWKPTYDLEEMFARTIESFS